MKSLIYVIITLYLLNCVLSDECEDKVPKKVSDCTDYSLTDDEKTEYADLYGVADTCCYATGKKGGEEEPICIPYNKNEVNNAEIVNAVRTDNELDELKIECEDSNWLSLSLTFLFFGLLF